MEVMVGPTLSIDVSSSSSSSQAAFVRGDDKVVVGGGACLFLKEEESGENENGSGFGVEDSSDSSSSIGATGGDSEEEEEEENDDVSSKVQNRLNGSLPSLSSLEDSLPIKRGLSNHFTGKSKSFANLLDVSSVKDLQKAESPFNKRRRVLMANKWQRKSSFYSWQNPKSMPLLALNENDEDEDEDEDEDDNPRITTSSSSQDRKLKATVFNSQSCYSLADLQEHHHY